MRVVKGTLLALLCLVLVPAAAYAQASIAGVARDTSGAVLPGVTVEAASSALIEKVRSVATDGAGQFKILDLRPGTYSVTFTLPGFNTFRRDGIELAGGRQDAGPGVGRPAPVAAIDQKRPGAAPHQVIDSRHPDHPAADHDRIVRGHRGGPALAARLDPGCIRTNRADRGHVRRFATPAAPRRGGRAGSHPDCFTTRALRAQFRSRPGPLGG